MCYVSVSSQFCHVNGEAGSKFQKREDLIVLILFLGVLSSLVGLLLIKTKGNKILKKN